MGSNEEVQVLFRDIEGEYVGKVQLFFTSPPKYMLGRFCMSLPGGSLTNLPSEPDKVWKITLTRSSGIQIVLHCNGVEVVRAVFSNTHCSRWKDNWTKRVKIIVFYSADSATDFYMGLPGKQ